MENYRGVLYIPDESGTAIKVMCPLVDELIEDIDCMENQDINPEFIPKKFKSKENWQQICEECPFRDY